MIAKETTFSRESCEPTTQPHLTEVCFVGKKVFSLACKASQETEDINLGTRRDREENRVGKRRVA
jgi:hypothetical protein